MTMAQTETRTQITEVRTVGVPVADQDRALAFYVDKLGFEKRMDVPYRPGERWIEVAPPGGATTIALVKVGPDQATGIDTNVRLTTLNAQADNESLRARGVDADPEVMPFPVPMFALRDQDGNVLRIVVQPR